MSAESATPPTGRSWLKIALVLSLGLNLALLGFFAGRLGGPGWHGAVLDPARGFAPLLRELPDARRDALRPLLREQLQGRRAGLRAFRDAQRDVQQALVAEPFDAERLRVALAAQRELLAAHHHQSHQAFAALVARLTAAERALLVERLAERGRHHGERRPRPPEAPPGPR